jgi:sugar phosphate isomerase/epimerase
MDALPQDQRLISLAAGVVQEFPPEDVVVAAAQAGFNAVGIWCDLATWTNERTHNVIKAIAETGITVLDIEVAWLQPGEPADSQDRFIEIAKTINAKNILCVSSEPNISDTKKRFKRLCTLTEGSDIRIVLEFLAITEIDTLDKALEVITDVAHPAGGILIDSLHLQRTGSDVGDVAKLAQQSVASRLRPRARLLPYLQLCDASKTLKEGSTEGILEDALYLRQLPGDGELPLKDTLQAIGPDMPISLEIRSRALNEQFPDLQDRANAVFERTQQFLSTLS